MLWGGTTLGMVCIEAVTIDVPTADGTEQSSVVHAYSQSGPSSVLEDTYIVISEADWQAIVDGDIRAACIRFEFTKDDVHTVEWVYLDECSNKISHKYTANGVSGFSNGITFVNDGYDYVPIYAYFSNPLSDIHYIVPPSIADALVYVAG